MSILVEPFLRTLTEPRAEAPATARAHMQRQLRSAAEHLLWRYLRDCRLAGAKFRRQHLVDVYLADFLCPEAKLVIELESTLTPALTTHAEARRAFFHSKGFKVLRVRDRDVLVETRAVLNTIRDVIAFERA
ncbi:MAG: DUF559 domain-containing protein [Burkholderiales bacterium]